MTARWLGKSADDVRQLCGDEPLDDSPLTDEQLDILDAWLELNARGEHGIQRPPIHPVQDMALLYRAVHELLALRLRVNLQTQ